MFETGDTATAKIIYQRVLEETPHSPEAISGMLSAAIIEDSTTDQIVWSKQLLQFRPWHREANIINGKALLNDGNLKDAVIRFSLALQNSTFKNEKEEALALLQKAAIHTQNRVREQIQQIQGQQNDSAQQPPELR